MPDHDHHAEIGATNWCVAPFRAALRLISGIVRDTRPNAPDGGTVFKPDLEKDPNFAIKKIGSYTSIFTTDQLADGAVTPPPPSPPSPEPRQGSVGVPNASSEGSIHTVAPAPGSTKDWGTYIPPEELAKHDGELGILGRILLGMVPPDRDDHDSWA